MTAPAVEEYLSDAEDSPLELSVVTDAGTEAGWMLLVALGWDGSTAYRMPVRPEGTYTAGWVHLATVDNGLGLPKWRVWGHVVESTGAVTVTIPAVTGVTADAHLHVLVLSGTPSAPRRAFRVRTTEGSDEGTSLVAGQVYAAGTTDRLFGFWMADTAVNLTVPGSMTALAEEDTAGATSRVGHEALSAHGVTGTRTTTASATVTYAALLVAAQDGSSAVTFPGTILGLRVEGAFGADLAEHPDDWTYTTITTDVKRENWIQSVSGRADRSRLIEGGTLALTLKNIISGETGGKYSSQNPLSPYFGLLGVRTPIRAWINPGDGWSEYGSAFVPAWSPRWTTGRNRTVPVSAKGLIYWLSTVDTEEMSPIKRHFLRGATAALQYWPCEDEIRSSQVASALPDMPPLKVDGTVNFAATPADHIADIGTLPLPSLAEGGRLRGTIPTSSVSPVQWSVLCLARSWAATHGADIRILEWTTPGGSFVRWALAQDSGGGETRVDGYTSAGAVTTVLSFAGGFAQLNEYKIVMSQSGANVNAALMSNGNVLATDTRAGTLAMPRDIIANPDSVVVEPDPVPTFTFDNDLIVGHIAVHPLYATTPSSAVAGGLDPQTGIIIGPLLANRGESAATRLARLCEEQGIPIVVEPATATEPLGYQRTGTFLEILREVEATDAGVLYELGFGLGYVPRSAMANRPVELAMDYDNRPLWENPEPTDDDTALINAQTVSQTGGSSFTSEDTASIARYGRKAGSVIPTTYYDENRLADRAVWEVGRGTVREYRWPELSLNFGRAAGVPLIPDWLGMAPQAGRLTLANPPADVPPETVDLIREGIVQAVRQDEWTARANCSPASLWNAWTVEGGGNTGRLGTAGHVVAVDTQDDFTTLRVRRAAATLKTIGTDTGYDLEVTPAGYSAGERMTVTAIADVTPSFVAAGAVDHDVNASVVPTLPGHAAGDSLYVLAAIRNSGAGVPFTASSGWERLAVFPTDSNVQLFGKTARSAAESDPTIQFTGGVANADTSAQAFRARGTTLDIIAAAAQLNASTQHIDYPALTLPDGLLNRVSVFILYLGWKQDDWTSVATISGGAAEIGEPDTTTGDDQGIVWDRLLQTTAANIPAGSFTVTGGAAAISRGAVVAFYVVEQNLTVTRGVNGVALDFTHGDTVDLWRPYGLAL